jgi:hypothetical protein
MMVICSKYGYLLIGQAFVWLKSLGNLADNILLFVKEATICRFPF